MSDNTSMAAIYLPLKPNNFSVPGSSLIKNIRQQISRSISKASGLNLNNFNPAVFAVNIAATCKNVSDVQYIMAVLSLLTEKKAVRNKIVLDMFFDLLAPVLNMQCYQMGFSNLNQMKSAIQSGINVDISAFLQGLYNSLSIFNSAQKVNVVYKKYGDVLNIDVVKACSFEFSVKKAEHSIADINADLNTGGFKIPLGLVNSSCNFVVSPLNVVKMSFKGNIYNQNGDLVKTNYIMQKLSYCMSSGILVAFRIGKDVYEKCLIESVRPRIVDAYNLEISLELSIPYKKGFLNV